MTIFGPKPRTKWNTGTKDEYRTQFFLPLHKVNSQNELFTMLSCFKKLNKNQLQNNNFFIFT